MTYKYTVALINSFGCDLGVESFDTIAEVRKYVSDYLSIMVDGDQMVFGVNEELDFGREENE